MASASPSTPRPQTSQSPLPPLDSVQAGAEQQDERMTREMLPRREQRLWRAACARVGGLRLVLEGLEDRGNRAALLRSAEAIGLLHVHEITAYPADGEGDVSRGGKVSLKRGRKFSSEEGRARGVAHGGEKWLWMHAHARASDCAAALRDKGFRLLGAVVPESDASASWHPRNRKRSRSANGAAEAAAVTGAAETAAATSAASEEAAEAEEAEEAEEAKTAGALTVAEAAARGEGSGEPAEASRVDGPQRENGEECVELGAEVSSPGAAATDRVKRKPVPLTEVDFGQRCAIVFGNERLGLSAEMLAICDDLVTIPLWGLTESLNVSVAGAIAMHHGRVARMAALRRAKPHAHTDTHAHAHAHAHAQPHAHTHMGAPACATIDTGAAAHSSKALSALNISRANREHHLHHHHQASADVLNPYGGDLTEDECQSLLDEYLSRGRHHAKGGRAHADAL